MTSGWPPGPGNGSSATAPRSARGTRVPRAPTRARTRLCCARTNSTKLSTRRRTRPGTGRAGCRSRCGRSPGCSGPDGSRVMDELITGTAHDPHGTLGAHPAKDETVIRTLRRGATDVSVVAGDQRYPMKRVHDEGIFEAVVPGAVSDYRVDVDGTVCDDPYRYPPTLGELDLHLIREGRHEKLWRVLGSHTRDNGVAFAVWAPNARGVRVVGEFTGWGPHDGWPMRSMGASGVWELFVPGATTGQRYKYRILGRDGTWRE